MLTGRVIGNEAVLHPSVELFVYGPSSVGLRVQAVVDTGFNGYLKLSIHWIRKLGLQFVAEEDLALANGVEVTFDVYVALVEWDGEMRYVRVLCAEGDPLIGMEMLRDHDLHVRAIPDGNVSIAPIG